MRRGLALAAFALTLVATHARAQNPKDTCVDASERGQKLVDDRKLLEARNAFLSCAQASCPAPVRRDCQTQLDDLKKNVPSVIIRVKEKDGSDAAQGSISLDGTKIGVLDGQTLEMNPGTHKIHVDLPDGRTYDRQVILAAGEKAREVTFDAAQQQGAQVEEKPASGTKWSKLKTAGLITIIVGGTTLAVSAVTFALTLVAQNNAVALKGQSSNCPTLDPQPPDYATNYDSKCQEAIADHSQAISMQNATIGLAIGGAVALIGGIVMFIVGGNEPAKKSALRVMPLVSPSSAGLAFGGSF